MSTTGGVGHLTPMQRQVVRLCSLGCTVKETARILNLSPNTVENHKTEAMKRAGARNGAQLTRYAIQRGISPLGDTLTPAEMARSTAVPDGSGASPASNESNPIGWSHSGSAS